MSRSLQVGRWSQRPAARGGRWRAARGAQLSIPLRRPSPPLVPLYPEPDQWILQIKTSHIRKIVHSANCWQARAKGALLLRGASKGLRRSAALLVQWDKSSTTWCGTGQRRGGSAQQAANLGRHAPTLAAGSKYWGDS